MLQQKVKIADVCFIGICAVLVILLGIGIFLFPRKSYSEQENRVLAPTPKIAMSSVMDGSFFDGVSSFYSDHIPLRRYMISAKATCELCLGKRQNNGVIFSSDGVLTDRLEYDDTSLLFKNLSGIERFAQKSEAVLIVVPRSVDVRFCELEQASQISKFANQALTERLRVLKQSGADPYYATDHHLNATGILALYEQLSAPLGYTPASFERQTVSDAFLGSVYSKAGLVDTGADELTLLRYEGDKKICVSCFDDGCEQSSLYDWQRLEHKDKYAVFLGGNHGLMEISEASMSKPRVLLIKDSFANALIPLLAKHFELTVVDPRYYEGSITALSENGEYDHVLMLFGADTLTTTGFSKSFAY